MLGEDRKNFGNAIIVSRRESRSRSARMNSKQSVTTLFLDIGGVLLTKGWGKDSRMLAAKKFRLDLQEEEEKHNEAWPSYEEGRLTLDQYLDMVIFHTRRTFSREQFRTFMFAQSRPFPKMLELAKRLKEGDGLKIGIVSNEGRELNDHRVRKFKLDEFVDYFISSCFVQVRKPNPQIYRLALDIGQAHPSRVLVLDDTPMFVREAERMGMRGIVHKDYESTLSELRSLGLGR